MSQAIQSALFFLWSASLHRPLSDPAKLAPDAYIRDMRAKHCLRRNAINAVAILEARQESLAQPCRGVVFNRVSNVTASNDQLLLLFGSAPSRSLRIPFRNFRSTSSSSGQQQIQIPAFAFSRPSIASTIPLTVDYLDGTPRCAPLRKPTIDRLSPITCQCSLAIIKHGTKTSEDVS